jgi:hypothetical protein
MFAEVGTFYWTRVYGRNWEHIFPNFDYPTFFVSNKNGMKQFLSKNAVKNADALPHMQRIYVYC